VNKMCLDFSRYQKIAISIAILEATATTHDTKRHGNTVKPATHGLLAQIRRNFHSEHYIKCTNFLESIDESFLGPPYTSCSLLSRYFVGGAA